jgi:hypothetical protein
LHRSSQIFTEVEAYCFRGGRFAPRFLLRSNCEIRVSIEREAKALDFLFWLRGQQKSPEIVLVQIDEQAFRNLGEKQPLPRGYLAGLIETSKSFLLLSCCSIAQRTDSQHLPLLPCSEAVCIVFALEGLLLA